ncbi:hypothetical protein ACFL2B_01570 [Patescibacteria group bacterium]
MNSVKSFNDGRKEMREFLLKLVAVLVVCTAVSGGLGILAFTSHWVETPSGKQAIAASAHAEAARTYGDASLARPEEIRYFADRAFSGYFFAAAIFYMIIVLASLYPAEFFWKKAETLSPQMAKPGFRFSIPRIAID